MPDNRAIDERAPLAFCDSKSRPVPDFVIDGHRFVGASDAANRIRRMICRLSGTSATTLVEGPTGTGKDIVALLLHRNSPRAKGPLVPINCAAIPDTMIEGEMFGYEKGAFSSAVRAYPGKFGLADGGTLFLDEVGELSLSAQAKILRALETGEVFSLGSLRPRRCSVRVVAATNRDLVKEVAAGRFRSDLYFRLAVVKIEIPPLRDRRGDIEPITRHLVDQIAAQLDCPAPHIDADALRALKARAWEGNVRELRNALEHAMVVGEDRERISAADLPAPFAAASAEEREPSPPLNPRAHLLQAIRACGGSKSDAARQLNISRTTLYRRLQREGLDPAIL
ncbi:sigma-54 interaction domain-containing protein [Novosphingobium beihaiensis]|uniref:sigma-54 interaction domain-containing protein n=1 Tax=Novosphingobium beihaiensis TaxID=2930389 RepID=UPI001FBAAF09|nr:sigma-54 dependent transcriptional regulator [Novosphingobium beihaiensis]